MFTEHLGVEFEYVTYTDALENVMAQKGLPARVWRSHVDPASVLDFNEFKGMILVGSEIELNVYGSENEPNLSHLVKMFEFLHCLDYMLNLYAGDLADDDCDVELVSVHVVHPSCPMSWDVGYASSYSFWDSQINHRSRRGISFT